MGCARNSAAHVGTKSEPHEQGASRFPGQFHPGESTELAIRLLRRSLRRGCAGIIIQAERALLLTEVDLRQYPRTFVTNGVREVVVECVVLDPLGLRCNYFFVATENLDFYLFSAAGPLDPVFAALQLRSC